MYKISADEMEFDVNVPEGATDVECLITEDGEARRISSATRFAPMQGEVQQDELSDRYVQTERAFASAKALFCKKKTTGSYICQGKADTKNTIAFEVRFGLILNRAIML